MSLLKGSRAEMGRELRFMFKFCSMVVVVFYGFLRFVEFWGPGSRALQGIRDTTENALTGGGGGIHALFVVIPCLTAAQYRQHSCAYEVQV